VSTYGGRPEDFIWDRSDPTNTIESTPYDVVDASTLLVIPTEYLLHPDGRPATAEDPLLTDSYGRYAFLTVNAVHAVKVRVTDSVGQTDWGPIPSIEAVQAAVDAAAGAWITSALLAAKGDLLTGTGPGTLTALTVGSDGQMLYADASTPSGLRWDTAPAGGSGGVSEPGILWVEDMPGADFTAKFRAAVTAATSVVWTVRPVIRWNTEVVQTLAVGATPIDLEDGIIISGGPINQSEFASSSHAQLTCSATQGVFRLKQGASVQTRDVVLHNISFQLANSSTDLFQQVTDGATGPILSYSHFHGISINGGKTHFVGRMLGCHWTGRGYSNNAYDTPFRFWGSDNHLWTNGFFLDSPNLADTEYLAIFENMTKSTVGIPYITGDGATPVRVNGGRDLRFVRAILEGQNSDVSPRPTPGADLWVAGGLVTLDSPWFFRAMQDPAATGRGDLGVIHQTGGDLTVISPTFAENAGETHNHIYSAGGVTRVVGRIKVLDYAGSSTSVPDMRAFKWATAGSGQVLFYGADPQTAPVMRYRVEKDGDSTKANNQSAGDDTVGTGTIALTLTVPAGKYKITGMMLYDAPTTEDIRFQVVSTGGSGKVLFDGLATGATGSATSVNRAPAALAAATLVGGVGAGTEVACPLKGTITVTTNPVRIQWAQGATGATGAILHSGSWFELERVPA